MYKTKSVKLVNKRKCSDPVRMASAQTGVKRFSRRRLGQKKCP